MHNFKEFKIDCLLTTKIPETVYEHFKFKKKK